MRYKFNKFKTFSTLMICVILVSAFFIFTDVAKAQSSTENKNIKIEITDGYKFSPRLKTKNGGTTDVFIPNLKKLQIKFTGADNVTINGKRLMKERQR